MNYGIAAIAFALLAIRYELRRIRIALEKTDARPRI